jgi:eukaryotic-like serine/threonine-protein kinase
MDATEELPAAALGAAAPLVLGRYRLGQRLGSGGFGTVFAARDERLDRAVAVKVIPVGAPAPERASREALAAARLDHPGIVQVFDAGEDGEARYLVSELVRGRTLDRLAAAGELSDRDVVRAGLALAEALEHAHDRGVIHRDVKPQNVIVPDKPRSARSAAKLTDFGVAHLAGDAPLTRTGDVVGTIAYMAPEQAAGRRVDERADLYSLALVLYEALAGVNPVRAGSPAATARKVGTVLPPLAKKRRNLPPELTDAIDRALRPKPEERGTLEDLTDALAAALPRMDDEGGTILAHPLERATTARIPPGAARVAAGLAAGGLVALALASRGEGGAPHGAGHAVGGGPADALAAGGLSAAAVVAGIAILVALVPRLGWLAGAAAVVATRAPGAAVLVAAALAPVPLLVRGTGRSWSLPALAPLLGAISLSGVYPAVAGRAGRALERAALGAAGAWWLLLAEPLTHTTLLSGTVTRTPGTARAAADAVATVATGQTAVLIAVWALAALILPWLVPGRRLAVDVVGASTWAAGLGAATATLAEWAHAGPPRGVTAAAVLAGAAAILVPRLLPRDIVEPPE